MRGGGQQQGGQSGSNDFLWVSAFFVVFAAIVWWRFGDAIRQNVLTFRVYQMEYVASFLTWAQPKVSEVLGRFSLPVPAILNPVKAYQILLGLGKADPQNMTFQAFGSWNAAVGNYVRFPYMVFCILMSLFLLLFYSGNANKKSFSMKSFRENEAGLWPYITPALRNDLVKIDLDDPDWGMSMPPMDFAKRYDLLDYITKDGQPSVRVKRGAASRAFALQMGHLWTGLESLPPHAQALFAVFAARAENDAEGANKLLAQIARSAAKGTKLDFSGTRELLVKHIQSKHVGRAVSPHAYVFTVMASMLELARMDGVVASSEFLWLKLVDRRMWYMLNNVGRQTAFPEVAGPFGHWLVEKRLRRPLKVPMVAEAVQALEEAVAQIKYTPEGY